MFTANGLLFGATRELPVASWRPMCSIWRQLTGIGAKLNTTAAGKTGGKCYSWLCSLEELYSRRNPEPAVLYALERPHAGTIDEPVNRSQGPNGLACARPLGCFSAQETPPFEISLLGAESAAWTHGDPWAFSLRLISQTF